MNLNGMPPLRRSLCDKGVLRHEAFSLDVSPEVVYNTCGRYDGVQPRC